MLLLVVVATVTMVAAVTTGLAIVEGRAIAWPDSGQLVATVGAAWLICAVYASLGMFLAVWLCSAATAIAVGLVWTLVIENIVIGLGQVLAPLGGTPGVLESAGLFPVVTRLGYIGLTVGGAVLLTMRRDLI